MKNSFDCEVILDLLPLYLEHLTSKETESVVGEHLEECETCKQQYLEMASSFTDVFLERKEVRRGLWFGRKKRRLYYKRKTWLTLFVYGYAFFMLAIIVFCWILTPIIFS